MINAATAEGDNDVRPGAALFAAFDACGFIH